MDCCCCVVVLRPRETSNVMSGRSVNLTILFLGRLRPPTWLTRTSCTYFRLGGLSLPRKSVARLTDRPDMTLNVYRGRKTTMQQNNNESGALPTALFMENLIKSKGFMLITRSNGCLNELVWLVVLGLAAL